MSKGKIGILAIGNLLRSDEGIGQHILESLKNYLPEEVEFLDGGTSGMELLGFLEDKSRLLILDAVDNGGTPGDIVVWKGDSVPTYTKGNLSAHQMSFAEVLYWAHFIGAAPEEIALVGIHPETLEWGMDLSTAARASIPLAVEIVKNFLCEWGVKVTHSESPYVEESKIG